MVYSRRTSLFGTSDNFGLYNETIFELERLALHDEKVHSR